MEYSESSPRKTDDDGFHKSDPAKNEKLGLFLGFVASVLLALANTLISWLSPRLDYRWMYAQFLSPGLAFCIYRVYLYYQDPSAPQCSQGHSLYWQRDEKTGGYRLNWTSVRVPIRRLVLEVVTSVSITITFKYAALAGTNPGVIAIIFQTCVIWVALHFYIFQGQKLTFYDLTGMTFISVCVIIIGFARGRDEAITDDPKQNEVASTYSWEHVATIIMALWTGLVFYFQFAEMHYSSTYTKVYPTQANMDMCFLYTLIAIPVFIHEASSQPDLYGFYEIIVSNLVFVCVTFGCMLNGTALFYGKAGPIQAVESLKIVWQVLLSALVTATLPTLQESVGCLIGFFGLLVIVLNKEDQPENKNDQDYEESL